MDALLNQLDQLDKQREALLLQIRDQKRLDLLNQAKILLQDSSSLTIAEPDGIVDCWTVSRTNEPWYVTISIDQQAGWFSTFLHPNAPTVQLDVELFAQVCALLPK